MAIDIILANSGLPIKNGTMVVTCGVTGLPSSGNITYNKYVNNTPAISGIQNKFDNRFDDPSYYYGVGNSTVIGA